MKYVVRITALLVAFFLAYSTSHAEVFTGRHSSLGITIDAVDTSAIVNVSYNTVGISTFTPYTVEVCKKVGTQTTCADKRNESIVFGTNTHTFKNLTPSTSYTLVVTTNTGVNRSSIAFKTEVSFGALVFDAAGGNKARVTIPAGDKSQLYFIYHYNSISAAKRTDAPLKIESVALSAGQTAIITSSAPIEATHYARLVGKDAQGKASFLSPIAERGIFYSRDLKIDTSDTEAELLGFINKAKHEDYTGFKVRVYISKNTTVASDDPYYSPQRIESDGSYKVVLRNLTPNTPYYFKHVITSPLGTSETIEDKFPSSGAYTPEGSVGREVDFNDRSYSLLAPFPGLTTVLDPDLCREKKAEGNLGGGQICGINEFINLILKILVGVTAVMLVVRIIIEGYNYVVTDVPFLKASAKTHLFESVFGLILALSSFLILNTINPKLVAGEVSIRQEAVGAEPGNDGLGIEAVGKKLTLKTKSGKDIIVTSCDNSQMTSVTAFGTTFHIQKNLVPSIKRIDAKWKQLNPAYKIPLTVDDKKAMGGYVCRNTGGGKLSYHAYGLSVDINPSTNPFGKTLKTDMPKAFIQLWKDEGWGWGGDWTSVKDAMHFSKGKNEGGNMTVDD